MSVSEYCADVVTRTVVLGTGTSVGKTWVASSLIRAAPPRTCVGLKPIESGFSDGQDSDAAILHRSSGTGPSRPLYAFADPVAPWLAALRSRKDIDLEQITQWVASAEQSDATSHVLSSIVETAGGVFSPLTARSTNFELARALDPSFWILVADNSLGAIHHVSSALLAMAHLGRGPDIVVLSAPPAPDASTAENAELLARLYPHLPVVALGRDDRVGIARLAARLSQLQLT